MLVDQATMISHGRRHNMDQEQTAYEPTGSDILVLELNMQIRHDKTHEQY